PGEHAKLPVGQTLRSPDLRQQRAEGADAERVAEHEHAEDRRRVQAACGHGLEGCWTDTPARVTRRVQLHRRRPKVPREAYFLYVERGTEGANEADGPLSWL